MINPAPFLETLTSKLGGFEKVLDKKRPCKHSQAYLQ